VLTLSEAGTQRAEAEAQRANAAEAEVIHRKALLSEQGISEES
jgi:hypothetical protein